MEALLEINKQITEHIGNRLLKPADFKNDTALAFLEYQYDNDQLAGHYFYAASHGTAFHEVNY